jgi:PST family polysaccharide transporter/lipopolysaccharide exporter
MVDSLRVLCILGMIRTLHGVNVALFQGAGKPYYMTYISAARLAMMAVMIYPLTVAYHILGTSIAVVVPMVLIQGWSFKKACEIIQERLTVVLKVLSPSLIGMLVMVTALSVVKYLIVNTNSIVWLFSMVLLGAVVYLGSIVLLNRKIFTEMRSLLKSIG